jgi:hypothetical protein
MPIGRIQSRGIQTEDTSFDTLQFDASYCILAHDPGLD